ncbi:class I tRNA ligase family protein [Candidatus Parcubacteria bacterium]|nr:class I tRNA ligase family protein [Candidatus Parcubacteria bacterium]
MQKYNPQEIEPKWQKVWEDTGVYRAVDGDKTRSKYYMLTEFPYPSGEGLHLGHAREYTLGDVMARHKRMQGYNVLYPMGYDAFGLPTENFAIKHKIAPQTATARNVANFREQFNALGYGIDWSREVNTSDPNYYKWTQWLFLQFFKKGLAYQANIPINWCPKCKTGLANEEVVSGRHERCGTEVEKKLLNQWLLKITAYADRLIEGLKTVDYPERIATQQINWIGKSEGAEITFRIRDSKSEIGVFTTRPDTLGGATFLVLAPEHPLVEQITTEKQKAAVERYIKKVQSESELERQEEDRPKTGVWTGAMAVNPLNNQEIPVWIADYVLMGYGTGAIMAVPAHDERDFEFAQQFKLPIQQVIMPCADDTTNPPREGYQEVVRETVIVHLMDKATGKFALLDWHESLEGITTAIMGGVERGQTPEEAALTEIKEEAALHGVKIRKKLPWVTAAKYCASHKSQNRKAVTHVLLAEVENLEGQKAITDSEQKIHTLVWVGKDEVLHRLTPDHQKMVWEQLWRTTAITGEGELINSGQYNGLSGRAASRAIVDDLHRQGQAKASVKYKLRDWIFSRQHYWGEPIPIVHCPKCGAVPVPEDRLPVELPKVEHYEPTDTGESPLAAIAEWVNTECPQCGGKAKRETDTMPNWAGSSWYYLRYIDPHNPKAFADYNKLKYWGMVDLYLGSMEHTTLHLLYSRFWHQFLYDQKLVPTPEPYAARRGQGMVLAKDGRKMSKSLGNVVNPMVTIKAYGADTLRLYVMFMAPYDETTSWSDERLAGISRFLRRVWDLSQQLMQGGQPAGSGQKTGSDGAVVASIDRMTHQTIKKVHEDIEGMRFNTMVSSLMEYSNFLGAPDTRKILNDPGHRQLAQRTLRALILMLAPAAPHLAEELWSQLGETESVHVQGWPKYDPELIQEELVEIVLQVNGKLRGTMTLPAEADERQLEETAKAQEAVQRYLEGKKVIKTIVVPRKLVNFVVQ